MIRFILGIDNIFLLKREIYYRTRNGIVQVMTTELLFGPGFLKEESLSEQEKIQIQLLQKCEKIISDRLENS